MKVVACKNCAYFDFNEFTWISQNKRGGICRRYPPQVSDHGEDCHYPVVFSNDWCGEFYTVIPKKPKIAETEN